MGGNSKPCLILHSLQTVPPLGARLVYGLRRTEAYARERLLSHILFNRFILLILLYLITETFTPELHPALAAGILPKMAKPSSLIWARDKRTDFSVENVTGPPGVPLPVRVVVSPALFSPDDDRDEPAVNFSGLPDSCRLSAGSKRARSWYVPVGKLEGLLLLPEAACAGDFNVLVMIYDGKDVRDDTRTILFSIHAGEAMSAISPPVPAVSPAVEEALLKKGMLLLKNGDVSAARLNFETLALRGSSKGALAMAQSFDPEVLNSMAISGLRPDLTKAIEWYAKAAALGDQDAARRLSILNSVRPNKPVEDRTPTQ
jgi:hypothetical protein